MKKLIIALLIFALQHISHANTSTAKGLYCGTRGNFWGTLASEIAIPDYFPPEKFLTRLIISPFFSDLSMCEEDFEPVNLGESCLLHDQCYTRLGVFKDECDRDLLTRWERSCAERYQQSSYASSYCLDTCNYVVNFMYNALRYDDGYFCPSCRAFEIDQERAQRTGVSMGATKSADTTVLITVLKGKNLVFRSSTEGS
jgi:hypothetical protein